MVYKKWRMLMGKALFTLLYYMKNEKLGRVEKVIGKIPAYNLCT